MRHLAFRFFLPSLLATTGAMFLVPTLPLYLADQTDSLTVATALLASAAVGGMLWNLPAGRLLDRIGERRAFIGGIALSGGGTLLLSVVSGLALIGIVCIGAGAGQATRMLARQAYARRVVALHIRGRMMAVFGGLGRVSLLVGPLAGGLLAEAFGFQASFAVAGGLMLSGVVPALLAGPSHPGGPEERERPEHLGIDGLLREHGRILGLVGFGQLGVAVVRVGRLAVVPLYAESIGLDTAQIGLIVGISSGLDLLLFPVAGYLMDGYGRLFAIVPCFSLMGLGLILLPVVDTFWGVTAVSMLMGLGNGLGSGTMLTFQTDLAPDVHTAEFLGAMRFLADLGRIVGPVLVGVVADQLDLGASSVALGMIGLLTTAHFALVVGEPSRSRSPLMRMARGGSGSISR